MKYNIRTFAFFIFILIQGCALNFTGNYTNSTGFYVDVLVDSRFNQKEVDLIKGAAQEWHDKTYGAVNFNIITNYDVTNFHKLEKNFGHIVIFKSKSSEEYIKKADKEAKNTVLGYYDTTLGNPTISIVADRLVNQSDEYYYGVIIHEFGHAIGLRHMMIEGTVMYPHMDKSAYHLQKADLDQFCKMFMCWKEDYLEQN